MFRNNIIQITDIGDDALRVHARHRAYLEVEFLMPPEVEYIPVHCFVEVCVRLDGGFTVRLFLLEHRELLVDFDLSDYLVVEVFHRDGWRMVDGVWYMVCGVCVWWLP